MRVNLYTQEEFDTLFTAAQAMRPGITRELLIHVMSITDTLYEMTEEGKIDMGTAFELMQRSGLHWSELEREYSKGDERSNQAVGGGTTQAGVASNTYGPDGSPCGSFTRSDNGELDTSEQLVGQGLASAVVDADR